MNDKLPLVPSGAMWWNPEQLDEDSRHYLHLLIGIFEMLLEVSDAMHFRVLIRLIMKVLGSLLTGISAIGSVGYFSTKA